MTRLQKLLDAPPMQCGDHSCRALAEVERLKSLLRHVRGIEHNWRGRVEAQLFDEITAAYHEAASGSTNV